MTATLLITAVVALALFVVLRLASASGATIPDQPDSATRRKVVLVHGIWDAGVKMNRMALNLRSQGFATYTPTLAPNWGQLGLDELAQQLEEFIAKQIPPGENFDLVGFSMGGVICRYYLQRLGGLWRVDHFITLGAPHHGSVLAHFISNPGCRQMRPGSDFLNDLNSDIASLQKARFASIWTPLDLIIVPSSSSRTEVSRNFPIWIAIHPLLVWSRKSLEIVASLLKA